MHCNICYISRSSGVRAVTYMVQKSVGVSPHRFESCLRQELNGTRTVVLVMKVFPSLYNTRISRDFFPTFVIFMYNHVKNMFHCSLKLNYMYTLNETGILLMTVFSLDDKSLKTFLVKS